MTVPSRIALAIGGGYLLGRTKKLKFAIIVRVATTFLAASPELARLRQVVRGQLFGAGRDAEIAGATHEIKALGPRIVTVAEPAEPLAIAEKDTSAEPNIVLEAVDEVDDQLMASTMLAPEEKRVGRRGEIRDSEVVKTHEEAPDEEQTDNIEAGDNEDQAEHDDSEEEPPHEGSSVVAARPYSAELRVGGRARTDDGPHSGAANSGGVGTIDEGEAHGSGSRTGPSRLASVGRGVPGAR